MGYRGPVTAEPFSARLNDIAADDPKRAALLVKSKMDDLWQAADLSE
jgi:predicted xylose isomerase-like sugar epimerase